MAAVLQTMSQEGSEGFAAGEELLTGTNVQTQGLEVTTRNMDRGQLCLYCMVTCTNQEQGNEFQVCSQHHLSMDDPRQECSLKSYFEFLKPSCPLVFWLSSSCCSRSVGIPREVGLSQIPWTSGREPHAWVQVPTSHQGFFQHVCHDTKLLSTELVICCMCF